MTLVASAQIEQTHFNQLDNGAMPNDWSERRLDDIADEAAPICYGIVQVRSHNPNGVPVLAIKNLEGDYITNLHHASPEVEKPYARSRVRPGDVLISVKGTTGRVGLVPNHFKGNISRDLARIRPRDGIISTFLFQMLRSNVAQQRLSMAVVGTTRMELSIAILREARIPIPRARREQEAIANALCDADALIESVEKLVAKKRRLKDGAMQELLTGKKRLPGFSGEWIATQLSQIAHIKTGARNNQDKVEEGSYPFFVRSATIERIHTYSHDCEAILVPGEGGIGSIFHYVSGRFDVHQRVYAITQFSDQVSGRFVYFYMTRAFGAYALRNSVKATVDSLRLPTFQEFELTIPPALAEQTAIARVLNDIDAEITALEAKLAKARQVKQGMMQQLLTGRIRLV